MVTAVEHDPMLLELDNLEVVAGEVDVPTNRLLTTLETAHYLQINEGRVQDMVRAGTIGGWLRIGKTIRFHLPSLDAWIVKQVEPGDSTVDSNTVGSYWSASPRTRGSSRVLHRQT